MPGTEIVRTFRLAGEGLRVHERVLGVGEIRDLDYTLPPLASCVDRQAGEISYTLR